MPKKAMKIVKDQNCLVDFLYLLDNLGKPWAVVFSVNVVATLVRICFLIICLLCLLFSDNLVDIFLMDLRQRFEKAGGSGRDFFSGLGEAIWLE